MARPLFFVRALACKTSPAARTDKGRRGSARQFRPFDQRQLVIF
ncbi:MAG: hypothetical protein Q9M45_00760 [Robiginitomaculum sp.]|nr:hypothetical protein [Robiginitomaculum sp.]